MIPGAMRRLAIAAAIGFLAAAPADARVIEFKVTNTAPAFEGASFGNVGTYERIDAVAEFAIDPASERGRRIVDLDKVPADENGLVRFSAEVTILRPTNPDKASGTLVYDVPNRGRNLLFMLMNLGDSSSLPATAQEAGDGYLMQEGYTIVWSGWQSGLPDESLNITLPTIPDVVGLSREEFVFDDAENVSVVNLTYPAADLDPKKATLTVRQDPEDPRATLPGLSFKYLSPKSIEIARPKGLDGGAIIEFIYRAKDAVPAGLGFAATSDLVSFLRGNPGHDAPAMLSGIEGTIGLGISQSGRFLRDLIYSGFNADEQGARVFDGAMPHIAGSRKTFTNYRFAQPGRYSRQHEEHDFPGDQFPFTYAETTDPLSGQKGSILSACNATGTCPKVMHTDTGTEFWQARSALISTAPTGEALTVPDNVRLYYIAGAPHFTAWDSKSALQPTCRFPSNPISSAPVMRALLVAMRDWIHEDKEPPASRYPSVADGTLVPIHELKLPDFGKEDYTPVYNILQVRDHRAIPPKDGPSYPVLVPQLDENGVPLGGISDPAMAAPLGTFWGWNLRKEGFASGNLCGLTGSFIPLPESAGSGDSRKALKERYPDVKAYLAALSEKGEELVAAGLLREADRAIILERGKAMFEAR